eukprot:272713-Prymnesium_polylepis.1
MSPELDGRWGGGYAPSCPPSFTPRFPLVIRRVVIPVPQLTHPVRISIACDTLSSRSCATVLVRAAALGEPATWKHTGTGVGYGLPPVYVGARFGTFFGDCVPARHDVDFAPPGGG